MAKSADEINALSYRELQQECKSQGINAKGAKLELIGRLLQHYNVQASPATAYKTPSSAVKEARGRRDSLTSPPAPSPSKRKSLDDKTIRKALATPLPVSPEYKTPTGRAPRGGKKRPSVARTTALIAAVLVAVLAAGVSYCQSHSCPAEAHQAIDYARSKADIATQQGQMWAYEAQRAVVQAKDSGTAVLADWAGKITALVTGSSGSGSSTGPSFSGTLDPKPLTSLLPHLPSGDEWDNAQKALTDIWSGARLQDNKANVVLFATASSSGSDAVAEAVQAAVPASTLLAFPAGGVPKQPGELQKRIVSFLKAHPKGVVLIEGVELVDLDVVSVLVNVLGEFGALTSDGVSISGTGATFFLTMTGPAELMLEGVESSFMSGAKVALSTALLEQLGDAENEDVTAKVRALRRRVDLVVKVQS